MLTSLLALVTGATAAPLFSTLASRRADPCTAIAGKSLVTPAAARACLESFPFNETIRQNVLANIRGVADFYSFYDYALDPPAAFAKGSTLDINAALKRIEKTSYASDYAFQYDLFSTLNSGLNDGHTIFITDCYWGAFQNLLPFPIVPLASSAALPFNKAEIRIAPDASHLSAGVPGFQDLYPYDLASYDGALLISVNNMPAASWVDHIANTVSGNYLDHGVRTNSVFTGYRLLSTGWSQRFGDFAGALFPNLDGLSLKVQRVNATAPETIWVPFYASVLNSDFTDSASYYDNYCAVKDTSNADIEDALKASRAEKKLMAKSQLAKDKTAIEAVGLPSPGVPTNETLTHFSNGTGLRFYNLEDAPHIGVMMVGTFSPDSFDDFADAVIYGLPALKKSTTHLIIDLSLNGGGYIYLGEVMHRVLAGVRVDDNFGFETTWRAAPLAKKMEAHVIAANLNESGYYPDGYAYPDNPAALNADDNIFIPGTRVRISPSVIDYQSDRVADIDTEDDWDGLVSKPIYDLKNVAIVSNGNCASTCAQFATVMKERHNTPVFVYGGSPTTPTIQYKGMAGAQVLEWADLDAEIIYAGFDKDPLRPPQVIIDVNMRYNWRTAYSWIDNNTPIAYRDDQPTGRISLTSETYNSPAKVWSQVALILNWV